MRTGGVPAFEPLRTGGYTIGTGASQDATSGFSPAFPGNWRRALRPGLAWMDGLVCASGIGDETAGSLPRGGERASWAGGSNGSTIGASSSSQRYETVRFDEAVAPGGYSWWYVDALSDDGQYGLTIIAFIGSVFSPYYAWSGWRDPLNHCTMNVVLYGPEKKLWAMTERGCNKVFRNEKSLVIGPSSINWDGSALDISIDEMTFPFGTRLRGKVRVEPKAVNPQHFALDRPERHLWWPFAPMSRVSLDFSAPTLRFNGEGYFDMNKGTEPLEAAFRSWTWSRANLSKGAAIFYDTERLKDGPLALSLQFDSKGKCEQHEPPPIAKLPRTGWRLSRHTRSDDGAASIIKTFEDTPFYSRALLSTKQFGEPVEAVHESLSLKRFSNPIVRMMLPFKMPRH